MAMLDHPAQAGPGETLAAVDVPVLCMPKWRRGRPVLSIMVLTSDRPDALHVPIGINLGQFQQLVLFFLDSKADLFSVLLQDSPPMVPMV